MVPDEVKTFGELKDKADRDEFRKIFWARRDPDPGTAANEFQAEFEAARGQANTRFRVPGYDGARTDCGRTFILLGPPDEVKKPAMESATLRSPEIWLYRNKPWAKEEVQIGFDAECRFPKDSGLGTQLDKFAQSRIVHPNLDYKRTPDGRLVKLDQQLPKASPASALLKTPRQDFPAAAEALMYLRGPQDSTYVAGLVRTDPGGLAVQEAGGKKTVKAVVATQATDEAGHASTIAEQAVSGEPAADGSFVAGYGLALKPGKYTVRVAVLDPAGGKGSVATHPVEIPSMAAPAGVVIPALLILRDAVEAPAAVDDPLNAFRLGAVRLEPRFGNAFKQSESIRLFALVFNPTPDATTGKPSFTMTWEIRSETQTVAKAPAQTFEQERGAEVGPVPLTNYAPGKYVAKVTVTDNVAKKDHVRETTFQVIP
jgi:GWxTD domain-containing protein